MLWPVSVLAKTAPGVQLFLQTVAASIKHDFNGREIKIHIQIYLWCWKPNPIRFSELQQFYVTVNGFFRLAWKSIWMPVIHQYLVVTPSFPHLSACSDHPPCQACSARNGYRNQHGERGKWMGNLCCLLPAKGGDHRRFQPCVPTLTGCSQEASVSKGHLYRYALVETLQLRAASSIWSNQL